MPVGDGRALLHELTAFVTQPRSCYRHEWRPGDLIVWENRCVLHRATPYDTVRNKRFMQRTALSGEPREPAAR